MICYIIVGAVFVCLGMWTALASEAVHDFICGICLGAIGGILVMYGGWEMSNPTTTYYLEAEPLAYNYEANLTYFTSTEGQFKAEGIYPENTYLLTMGNNGTSDKEDDTVLVVWEPSKGEVG